ncbi:ATP-binding protein [Mucisphaera sp.]|uniref:DNA polymerase III subunit n=1 Tax=Mucisphaera sp. TaxID=2913024 RepID=UPI003D150BB5
MQKLIGQPKATELLQRQLQADRLHHAYIFHGPQGVGKMTCALAFAGAFLCHDPQDGQACGDCNSCKALGDDILNAAGLSHDDEGTLSLNHPDLHVIAKELARYHKDSQVRNRKLTQIPAEILRDTLIEPAHKAAQLGQRKAFIVDEAELLNPTGQNTLLKTLEEPPDGTMIILVTSSEDQLLPTIRSRCQRIPFIPLPEQAVEDYLEQHAPNLPSPTRQQLASLADGSLGRARIAIDFELHHWINTLTPHLDAIDQGSPQPELGAEIHQAIDGFAAAWVDKHAGASKEAANRLGLGLMASLLSGRARRALATHAPNLDPDDPIAAEQTLAGPLTTIDAVDHWQGLVRSNVNLSLACDHLVATLERATLN